MKEPAEETARISDLKLDPKNARRRTKRSSAMLEKSLEEIGAARSIVIDENNRILAGNGTVEAAGQVGIERVRIIEADGNEIIAVRRRHLTDEEKTKLALYDNRTAELAEWDVDAILSIRESDANVIDSMFHKEELYAMIAEAGPDMENESLPLTPGESGQWDVSVTCVSEADQRVTYWALRDMGYTVNTHTKATPARMTNDE